jgi:hypothetical protein
VATRDKVVDRLVHALIEDLGAGTLSPERLAEALKRLVQLRSLALGNPP